MRSASAPMRASRCGTGSAGATRCGRPSASRSSSRSAATISRRCWPGRRRWMRISASSRFADNLPVLLGLIAHWNRNLQGCASHAVLPYTQRLARLPAYLQQLEMESLGKRVTRAGEPVAGETGAVIWGEPGSNAQHSFFQLLHQGTAAVSADFLLPLQGAADRAADELVDRQLPRPDAGADGRPRIAGASPRASGQPAAVADRVRAARSGDARGARSRSTSTRSSSSRSCGTSTPSTSGASSSARRSARACCRSGRRRPAELAGSAALDRGHRRR